MEQTDELSCLMSAQEREKQNLCMSTHEEHEKMTVTIDSGACEQEHRWRSSSRTRSRIQQLKARRSRQQLGSKQKILSTLVRGTFESSTITARRVGPSSRCAEDSVKR